MPGKACVVSEMVSSASVTTSPMTVVLVDDHELVRRALKSLLSEDANIQVVGEAVDSEEAISLISQLQPDLAIVDIRLREGSGIDVARAAKTVAPRTKILVLTAYDHEQYVHALARLGVAGYVLKTASAAELKRAIGDVVEGRLVFEPPVADKVMSLLRQDDGRCQLRAKSTGNLTAREAEVLEHVGRGLKNREIASTMNIALKTVEAHVERIRMKLGVKSRSQAVFTAMQRGWLTYMSE